jgi:hypothetical protein
MLTRAHGTHAHVHAHAHACTTHARARRHKHTHINTDMDTLLPGRAHAPAHTNRHIHTHIQRHPQSFPLSPICLFSLHPPPLLPATRAGERSGKTEKVKPDNHHGAPTKDARGMITDVSSSELKGAAHMGSFMNPRKLKLLLPCRDSTAIHPKVTQE